MQNKSPLSLCIGLLFLACLYPFLGFYAHNISESYYFATIFSVMAGIFVLAVLGFLFIVKIWPKWQVANTAVAAAFALVVFFGFHHIEALTANLGIYLGTIKILIWLFLLLVVFFAGYKLASKPNLPSIVFFVFLGLNLAPFYTIATSLYNQISGKDKSAQTATRSNDKTTATAAGTPPNVYWIILDMYSRHDVLQEYYGFDNTDFLAGLSERGFYVAGDSYSNFQSTRLSLSTTLNMDYYLPVKTEMNPMLWQSKLQGDNNTVLKFREMGYKYLHIEPGGNTLKTRCGGSEDLCIHGPQNGAVSLNEAHVGMLRLTPFYRVLKNLKGNLFTFDFTTIEDIRKHIDPHKNTPFFAFTHILSPHPPARFTETCEYRERTEWELLETNDPNADKNYINDMKCLNAKVLDMLDWLVQEDPDAIILVQADHGRSPNQEGKDQTPENITRKEFWHRSHAIMNSYRAPVSCLQNLYSSISPVNNFPFVFSCIENTTFKPLPDRMFVIHDKPTYDKFHEEILEVQR
ncbi:MAG: sulfatase-like hydrolase/transferase [Micavibrio aeruginosavorus]|uniref:Sulfatase-like hydrolase/transferase n=1 Tax=Micavibrio aeruginosavorus TaxID=349221 RepID=A0A7T5R0Q0_9BACT|nr:MAG: sulfatase-like hydrolase/transferase [Micavibrio aeruginosavorus]